MTAAAVESRVVATAPEPPRGRRTRRTEAAEHAGVLGVLLVFGLPLTHDAGGRTSARLAWALAALLCALAVQRPWRWLPPRVVALALAPALAAVVTCLTAPTGFDGLGDAAALTFAGGLFLLLARYARDATRRTVLAVTLSLLALEQMQQAWLPWWGGEDAAKPMLGTFYWHNQFAAYIGALSLVAGAVAVLGSGRMRLVGWVVAPWCLAGLAFSASRAGIAAGLAGWLLLGAVALRRRRLRAWILALLAGLGLAALLASPLLMAHSGTPWSSTGAWQETNDVVGNGRARVSFWSAAWRLGLRHPLTGAGFGSFRGAGSALMPHGAGESIYVHNGYLQAWADGGALLLAALAAATVTPLLAGLRALARRPFATLGWPEAGALAGLLALFLHTGVDFDWAYPSLLALYAVLAAMLLGGRLAGWQPPREDRWARRAGAVALVALVLLAVPASARAVGVRSHPGGLPGLTAALGTGLPLHRPLTWLPAGSLCDGMLASADPATLRRAVACTRAAAADDPWLAMRRGEALLRLGRAGEALAGAHRAVIRNGMAHPMLGLDYAALLQLAGRDRQAAQVRDRWVSEIEQHGTAAERRAALQEDR